MQGADPDTRAGATGAGEGALELFRRQVAENLADHRHEMERLLARARRDLTEQREATADLAGRLESALEEDRRALDRLHASLSATLESLVATVEDLSAQMEALRRRIPLRARPASAALDEATVAAIAEALAQRLESGRPGPERGAP